jgi:hypothetical protein
MVQRSTDGGIGEYSMQQQRLSVVSGKKKERKRRRGGWLGQKGGLHEHLDWVATLGK